MNSKQPQHKLFVQTLFLNALVTIIILLVAGLLLKEFGGQIITKLVDEYVAEQRDVAQEEQRSSNLLLGEAALVDIVAEANPAVVSIVITKEVPVIEQYFEDYDPFRDFFGGGSGFGFQIPRQRQNGTEFREVGGGSGFLVSPDGFVITNRHVVDDDDAEYTAFTNDGEKYEVEVVARDPFLDIAVLKMKTGKDFSYLTFGDSENLKPGQTAIAIGNALAEFRNSVSVGIISGLARSVVAGDSFGNSELLEQVIQTDAAINPGNSGGPLLNSSGQVIGVNVAVATQSENIGFAIPSNVVKSIVDSVREYGEIIRPFIGVRYTLVTESLAEKNALSVDYGALVQRGDDPEALAVLPGSPADKAGIVENDIILEIDGEQITHNHSLASIIREKSVGQIVSIKLLHKGEEKMVEVKLEKAPADL